MSPKSGINCNILPSFYLFGPISGYMDSKEYGMAECFILNPASNEPQAEVGRIVPFSDAASAATHADRLALKVKVFFESTAPVFEKDRSGNLAYLTDAGWADLQACIENLDKQPKRDSRIYFLNKR